MQSFTATLQANIAARDKAEAELATTAAELTYEALQNLKDKIRAHDFDPATLLFTITNRFDELRQNVIIDVPLSEPRMVTSHVPTGDRVCPRETTG